MCWRLLEVFVGETHLQPSFQRIHATCASAKTRTSNGFDGPFSRSVVPMNGRQCRPHGEVYVVGALDVHRHTHRRCMRDKAMGGVVGGNNETGSDGLLAKMVFQDHLLNSLHHLLAEVFHHGEIHPRIHQAKGVACGDDAIKGPQVFEFTTDDLYFRMVAKLPTKQLTDFLVPVNEGQLHRLNRASLQGHA